MTNLYIMAYSMTKIRYSNLGKYGGGTNEKRNCYTIPKNAYTTKMDYDINLIIQ